MGKYCDRHHVFVEGACPDCEAMRVEVIEEMTPSSPDTLQADQWYADLGELIPMTRKEAETAMPGIGGRAHDHSVANGRVPTRPAVPAAPTTLEDVKRLGENARRHVDFNAALKRHVKELGCPHTFATIDRYPDQRLRVARCSCGENYRLIGGTADDTPGWVKNAIYRLGGAWRHDMDRERLPERFAVELTSEELPDYSETPDAVLERLVLTRRWELDGVREIVASALSPGWVHIFMFDDQQPMPPALFGRVREPGEPRRRAGL